MSTHIKGIVVRKTFNMYSVMKYFAAENSTDGKKSPTIMSTAMAAIINSTAILTTTPETCRIRGRPYRSFVSGLHVSVGISRKSMYKRSIASEIGGDNGRVAGGQLKYGIARVARWDVKNNMKLSFVVWSVEKEMTLLHSNGVEGILGARTYYCGAAV